MKQGKQITAKIGAGIPSDIFWPENYSQKRLEEWIGQSCRRQYSMGISRKGVDAVRLKLNGCETFFPLQHSKTPRTPNLSKICPSDCFWGFQSGGQNFEKNCQNLSENYGFTNFDNFFQSFGPLTGTPKNNRWDKFWTNLGFGAFLNAVRGEKGFATKWEEHRNTSERCALPCKEGMWSALCFRRVTSTN